MQAARLIFGLICLLGPLWIGCWLSSFIPRGVWWNLPLSATIAVSFMPTCVLGITILKTFVEEWAKNHDDTNGYD